jgi:hypothetical protein
MKRRFFYIFESVYLCVCVILMDWFRTEEKSLIIVYVFEKDDIMTSQHHLYFDDSNSIPRGTARSGKVSNVPYSKAQHGTAEVRLQLRQIIRIKNRVRQTERK